MKYMGSKKAMLETALGTIVLDAANRSDRFIDLFTGSGAVAAFVAEGADCEVLATDLQLYACALAAAIIERTAAIDPQALVTAWFARAREMLDGADLYHASCALEGETWLHARRITVAIAREIGESDASWPFAVAYAGHYYSPKQAYELEALRRTLPEEPAHRRVALAALIASASECAAAPGHTAQPFSASASGAKFLFDAWRRDVFARTHVNVADLATRCAQREGRAWVEDAATVVNTVGPGDVVFVDPPYSAVHYSRFYHVLETLARGRSGEVSGVGRYPPPSERPKSAYSNKAGARNAVEALLSALGERGAAAVITFPRDTASNGLSGVEIAAFAEERFRVERHDVNGRFSTLGGGPAGRGARIPAYEVILVLEPL